MRLQRLSFLFMNDLVYLYWHAIKKKNYFNILYYSNHDILRLEEVVQFRDLNFQPLQLKRKIEISKIIQVTR